MVYRFKIDGKLIGEFVDRTSIHEALVSEGYTPIVPDSDGYCIRVDGVVTGVGEVVKTLPFVDFEELPKS
jgi:hypothetical protein